MIVLFLNFGFPVKQFSVIAPDVPEAVPMGSFNHILI
jgi:hypothetical protein